MKLHYKLANIIYDFRSRRQRFARGWADGDVWNMNDWFIKTVEPMLKHLRDNGCGVPNELYDEGLDSREQWEAVLDEMVRCLHLMDEENVRMALGLYRRHGLSYDEHKRIGDTMEENKNRFFELFSKWFFDLWD